MIEGDVVNVSIDVAVDPAEAFRLFTEDIDLWWKTDPAYRVTKSSLLKFEPYTGGQVSGYSRIPRYTARGWQGAGLAAAGPTGIRMARNQL